MHTCADIGRILWQFGHSRLGSSRSFRLRIAATNPITGIRNPITNHRKNELPLRRPTTPVITPKIRGIRKYCTR